MRAVRLEAGDRGELLALRGAAFGAAGALWDAFDSGCEHWGVRADGALAGAVRLRGGDARSGYAARFFAVAPGPVLEVGRLCARSPAALRPLLGVVAARAAAHRARRLIGPVALPGLDGHDAGLAAWGRVDPSGLPPLARLYLSLGARLSDAAVPDPDFGTTLLLATLDVADVPPARRRSLMALAASVDAPRGAA